MRPLLALILASLLGMTPAAASELWPTSHFAPPADATTPEGDHSGILRLDSAKAEHFEIHHNAFRMGNAQLALDRVPPLEIALVQDGSRMIPAVRGPIRGAHLHWEWIVQPGVIWQDADGSSVVSLPVALTERNANCVHNGLLIVNLDGPQAGTADFQIASETCAYFHADLRAQLPASFAKTPIADAPALRDADRAERAARPAARPLADLPYAALLASKDEVPEGSLTAHGLMLDGTHYVSDCPTRAGPYPFCDDLVLPSYSFAKSLFAGMAAMRMEKLYPGAMQESIATFVGGCEDDWADVTFAHALNMASGHYRESGHEVDEGSELMRRFFLAEYHPEKITIACRGFPRRTDAGERFVYRTADTYIFGTALTGLLRTERQNAAADLQTDILQPIWDRLQLSPLMAHPRRTYDDSAIPFSGWGQYLTRDDLVRVTGFLQNGGAIDGEQLLDPGMLGEALQHGEAAPFGLEAVSSDQRYRHGFWAWNAGNYLGCGGDKWVPALSGFGGLTAALLPSGAVYYYISDGYAFRWAGAAKAIHAAVPQC